VSARAAAILVAASLVGGCGGPRADVARHAPVVAHLALASSTAARDEPPPTTPLAGDVVTDLRDVRACAPLADGRTLAATAGGLWLVGRGGDTLAVATSLDGLPDTKTHALHEIDATRFAVGTEGGVAIVEIGAASIAIERAAASAPVRAIERRGDELVLATWGDGVARARLDLSTSKRGGALARIPSAESRFTSLAAVGALLFAGGPSGVARVDARALTPIDAAERGAPVFALAARGDELFIGGLAGLRRRAADGEATSESSQEVRALAYDGEDLLVAAPGHGVLMSTHTALAALPSLGAAASSAQAVGAAHGARCVGASDGLFVQARRGEPFRAVAAPALPSGDLSAVARDGDAVWIGAFDHGLARLEAGRFTKVDGVDARVNAIAVEGHAAWIATARGLFHVAPRGSGFAVTATTAADGLPSSDVHAAVLLSDGALLVGTAAGAALVQGGAVTPLAAKVGIPRGGVWAVAELHAGASRLLVLGTSRGLLVGAVDRDGVVARTDPRAEPPAAAKAWTSYSMATGDLDDDWVTALAVKGSSIYVGTYNAGVTRLDLAPAAPANAVRAARVADGYVNFGALALVGDRLYAGTMTGLVAIGARGGATQVLRAAPGVDVTAIAPFDGGAWIASRRGLARWRS
jgi:hypothetical protein